MAVALFQSAGTLGGRGSSLFKNARPAVVQVKQEEQQQPQQQETKRVTVKSEEPPAAVEASSTKGTKRKREGEDEEAEKKKEEEPKTKKARTKKNNKKKGEEEEEEEEAEAKKKGESVELLFHQTSKAMLGIFRNVSGECMAKILKFQHLRPAKSKGGLDRLHELIANYHRDFGSKIKVYGDVPKVYKARMLELIKGKLPQLPETQHDEVAEVFAQAMKNEALMVAMHTDTECGVCVAKALDHLATLGPDPADMSTA